MFQAKVNNQLTLLVNPANYLEGIDIIALKSGKYHLLKNNTSYNAEVVHIDSDSKTVKVRVNNTNYTVAIKDKLDLLLEQMGIADKANAKINDLKAPMPGLVLEIKVQVGDTIEKGDVIVVLEAMKMENVLKATATARIKSIEIRQGLAVEKGQVLVRFE
jgi:acetyl/propionyl-CoA carboxylase alpha subunit